MNNNPQSKDSILILNVGSNPLPNYVVAKYLILENRFKDVLPSPSIILLIYSNDTKRYALSIGNKLKNDVENDEAMRNAIRKGNRSLKVRYVSIENNHMDFNMLHDNLKERITKRINEIREKTNRKVEYVFHINITGGTKIMVFQDYFTIKNNFLENREPTISYLDSKQFKLSVKKFNQQARYFPTNGDIRDIVKLNVEDIVKLHDMKYIPARDSVSNYFHTILCRDFINLVQNTEKKWFFKLWRELKRSINRKNNHVIFPRGENKNSYLNSIQKFMNNTNLNQTTINTLNNMREAMEIINDGNDQHTRDIWKLIVDFITGGWLEELIFDTISKIDGVDFYDKKLNVETHYENRKNEIDIIVTIGYQLYLISITTSRYIKRVKLKAFEVLYRAEQLGGEHAKSIVISLLDNDQINTLNHDLTEFRAKRNCYLIGKDPLLCEMGLLTSGNNFRLLNILRRIFRREL